MARKSKADIMEFNTCKIVNNKISYISSKYFALAAVAKNITINVMLSEYFAPAEVAKHIFMLYML